jgi:hypothetical protein
MNPSMKRRNSLKISDEELDKMKMQPNGNGGFTGNIQKLGSGVFSNAVIEFPGQPGQAVLAGRFPPFDELLIL